MQKLHQFGAEIMLVAFSAVALTPVKAFKYWIFGLGRCRIIRGALRVLRRRTHAQSIADGRCIAILGSVLLIFFAANAQGIAAENHAGRMRDSAGRRAMDNRDEGDASGRWGW
jgi:hypothetical protein